MNIDIANALFDYFETVYYLNQKLIKLCGIDAIDNFENGVSEILDIIQNIPRIIPYSKNKSTKKLELKKRDGLLEYNGNIDYLKHSYDKILLDNYDFLEDVLKIRNKYEHKMHGIKRKSIYSSSLSLFDFTFKIDDKEITLYATSFIKFFKSINCLFSKLASDVESFAYENDKKDYIYYRKIIRFDFKDFNKIYENELLRTFGNLMKKF